jgi:hypothetical protein
MFKLRQHRESNRLIVLVVALLLSNIATFTCAMASALCADCPEHSPAACTNPCATDLAVLSDTTPNTSPDSCHSSGADFLRPFSAVNINLAAGPFISGATDPGSSAPPLYLRNCVFLK